jgi:hypothetical protein
MIGAQNAGKSSIIEGLSGIHFPCGEGLCTRCPVTVSLEVDPAIKHPVVVVRMQSSRTQNPPTPQCSTEYEPAVPPTHA